MSKDQRDLAVRIGPPACGMRQWWTVITALLLAAIFVEAAFAGAILSGVDWARRAHAANAMILVASTAIAGVAAIVTLRRTPGGTRLGLTLLALAAVLVLQIAMGKLSAEGANLMWVHVPLGVALAGFAVLAVGGARRLGGE